ncbi:hypothetical protein OW763_12265 [Clostridium aestuarii]|uniref:Major facilitator superfamily (MFS) profile domain-containing protein n=1 Tax=Clostridium aestuarii TaxID=338193 RepID=A0ABT4D1Y3_9CLOT|nr:MFS transporter [Clostridium aestuarii]MCY6485112.1 hypothetical protein [Clostridium aestuarii]
MIKKHKISIFYIVTTLFWFSLYSYVPILPNFARDLGAELKIVGLIIGSYGFTQMILRIPLGIYSDFLNNRKIFIILGIILSIISSLGMFVGPWLAGFLSDVFGLKVGFFVIGVIGIIGAVITFKVANVHNKETVQNII